MEDRPEENAILIVGQRTVDGTMAVLAGMGATVTSLLIVMALLDPTARLDGVFLLAIPIALLCLWLLVGSIWRLRDRAPMLRADQTGLRFHPSLLTNPLPWTAVKSAAVKRSWLGGARGAMPDLRIALHEPVRSFAYPFGSRAVRIPLRSLGLSYRQADKLLEQMRRLCKARD